jgi:hypothetical protein
MRRPGVRIPLPPVFARGVEESEDCRAVASAKADTFYLATSTRRATTRQASEQHGKVFLHLYFAERKRWEPILHWLNRRPAQTNQKPQLWPSSSHRKVEPMAIEGYIAFSDRSRAAQFEGYLKSASGICEKAFMTRPESFRVCRAEACRPTVVFMRRLVGEPLLAKAETDGKPCAGADRGLASRALGSIIQGDFGWWRRDWLLALRFERFI